MNNNKRNHGRQNSVPWRDLKYRSQAERIIRKFGNARRLSALLAQIDPSQSLNPSTIYRWTYPRERGGTGGYIPTAALPLIRKAAVMDGIILDEWDLHPDPQAKRDWSKDDFVDGEPIA